MHPDQPCSSRRRRGLVAELEDGSCTTQGTIAGGSLLFGWGRRFVMGQETHTAVAAAGTAGEDTAAWAYTAVVGCTGHCIPETGTGDGEEPPGTLRSRRRRGGEAFVYLREV